MTFASYGTAQNVRHLPASSVRTGANSQETIMAKRATTDLVASDMAPPKYREAVQLIRTIQAKKDKIAEVNGLIGGIWGKMEGHRVNRKAAQFFHALDKMDPADRKDILRSLDGLIEAAGWEDDADLVDKAENKVVAFRGGRKPNANGDADDAQTGGDGAETGGDDAGEAADDATSGDTEPAASRRISPAEARKRAKAHLEGSATTSETPSGEGEPFTGDNSDLAPE